MTTFGDHEPEDSWDPLDAPEELLANLRKRVALLVLAAIARRWEPRDQLRSEQLDEDMAYLIERLRTR